MHGNERNNQGVKRGIKNKRRKSLQRWLLEQQEVPKVLRRNTSILFGWFYNKEDF